MIKKNILFIPSSIRSHILPSIFLADLLAKKYEIFYAITNEIMGNIVEKQGYKCLANSSYRIHYGMENSFIKSSNKIIFNLIKSVIKNEIYWYRKKELDNILDEIKPVAVVLDIFCCTDFFALYSRRKDFKILFFNPMLSTYRIKAFPIVSERVWVKGSILEKSNLIERLKTVLNNPALFLLKKAMSYQLKELYKINKIPKENRIAKDGEITLIFDNITEIILAPLELEFSHSVKKNNQIYLGLCIKENRIETELDMSFDKQFECIIRKKNEGEKIIFCSFGTFYTGSNRLLLSFLEDLIQVINEMPNVQFICSVNQFVSDTLKYQNKLHQKIHFFSKVPQLKVLEISDVFITHGGLGSIKESIYYKVPLLVYPLDLQYDQNGNGFKVEYHDIGLRGILGSENKKDMVDKINNLLYDPTFKERIAKFQSNTIYKYDNESTKSLIIKLIENEI